MEMDKNTSATERLASYIIALGMLAAIPAYTVVRVIAGRFFYDKKPVRMLMPDIAHE